MSETYETYRIWHRQMLRLFPRLRPTRPSWRIRPRARRMLRGIAA